METYSIYSFVFEVIFFPSVCYFISDGSMWFLAVIVLGRFFFF